MKLFRSLAAAMIAGLSLSGCLYVNVVSPLDVDMYETRMGEKIGEASSYVLL